MNELRPAYHALRPLRFVLACICEPVVSYLDDLLKNVACRIIPAEPGSDFGGQVVAAKAHFGLIISNDGEDGSVYDEQGRAVSEQELCACSRERPANRAAFGAASHAPVADALRTLTTLLVLLSRDDSPLSTLLDRIDF